MKSKTLFFTKSSNGLMTPKDPSQVLDPSVPFRFPVSSAPRSNGFG